MVGPASGAVIEYQLRGDLRFGVLHGGVLACTVDRRTDLLAMASGASHRTKRFLPARRQRTKSAAGPSAPARPTHNADASF